MCATMQRFSVVFLLCLFYCSLISSTATVEVTCTMDYEMIEIEDGTCKNYYMCISDGVRLIPVQLSCANCTIFVPTEGRCMPEITFTCQQTTTVPSTTVAPCYRYGRFPIADIYCKKYYLCYWNGITYTKIDNLSCPNTLVFNPLSEKCVSPLTYKCVGN